MPLYVCGEHVVLGLFRCITSIGLYGFGIRHVEFAGLRVSGTGVALFGCLFLTSALECCCHDVLSLLAHPHHHTTPTACGT